MGMEIPKPVMIFCLLLSLVLCAPAKSSKEIDPLRKEVIANQGLTLLYGNAMVEKLQEEGSFETFMHLFNAGKKIQYRSCAYVGDQVGFRIRASRFGLHLKYLLDNWKADRVVMAFGSNEAYAGEGGIAKFEEELIAYLDVIVSRHGQIDYVLVSPTAAERDSSLQGLDLSQRNQDLALYTKVMKKVAATKGVAFVDLFTPTFELFANTDGVYTVNSQNLSDAGSAAVGAILADRLSKVNLSAAVSRESKAFKSVQTMVRRKALEVAQAYHPANGISYYGLRSRAYEYNYEIPHHLKLANILDQAIWLQASQPNQLVSTPELPIFKLSEVPNNPPSNGLGIVKTQEEDLDDFTVDSDFSLICFASSEDHPELINPLQMQFDSRGRLWVACFASYPHPLPGAVANDSVLIFEDTNHDGVADKKTVFAEGLNLPDGLVIYGNGAVVSTSRQLIYLEDTDNDGVADVRKEVLRGFDNTDTHHSGYLQRSPQGKVILSEALFHRGQFETLGGVVHTKDTSIMSLDMDTRQLTVERQVEAPNPWKVTYNQWGESIQFFGGGQIIDSEIHNVLTPMGSAAPDSLGMPFRYDKGVSATFVNSPAFPKEMQGGLITTHLLSTNEINFTPLKLVKGAYKSASKKQTLIKSSNKIFRPTDVVFGHDGALYISDFYYPIIGHAQHSIRHKDRDYANGRIWRLSYNKAPSLDVADLTQLPTKEVFELLKEPYLSIRQAARNELSIREGHVVEQLCQQAAQSVSVDQVFALELFWLMERQKDFSNTTFLKQLLRSDNAKVRSAATRSLRWWADSLGGELESVLKELAKDSEVRVQMALVTVLSHLQVKDDKWSKLAELIETPPSSPLGTMKSMLGWKERPGLAPEFPVLKIDPEAYLADNQWVKASDKKKGVLYFKSPEKMNCVIGHENNAFLNITLNDVPVLVAGGGPHSKESQNAVNTKEGVNKLEFSFISGGKYRGMVNSKFKMYICDSLGNQMKELSFPTEKDVAAFEQSYQQSQQDNWEEFAVNTYKTNCTNCHSLDTRAVGPPLKGLLGKNQTVVSKDGSKRAVTIDEAYIRRAIESPMTEYPEGYPPAMVLHNKLSETEIDTLVRWLVQLK